jgi:ABC-type oligopeptide transport system substrate-binding subunit
MGVSYQRALPNVEAGTADYTTLGGPGAAKVRNLASQLDARYGPGSAAAKHGRQQYFVDPQLALDYFELNTHQPLFRDVRLRQAVNYAIDRLALARLGQPFQPLARPPSRP